jgi:SAM-dependent methyltransferase
VENRSGEPSSRASHPDTVRLRRAYERYKATTKWDPSNAGNQVITREREGRLEILLAAEGVLPLESRLILDVGSGAGGLLRWFKTRGAGESKLFGIDLLYERVRRADELSPTMHFVCGDFRTACFRSEVFDLVCAFTVISSILDRPSARELCAEILRVLKPGGHVLWYDLRYSNPGNPDVRGIGLRELAELFPGCTLRGESITVLPPLTRRLGPMVSVLYPLLRCFPTLRTHYLAVLRKQPA